MKYSHFILAVTALTALSFTGCYLDNTDISGIVTYQSLCKSLKSEAVDDYTPDSLSCVSYEYDASAKTLTMTHINTAFNCCPGPITCDVVILSGAVVIRELETTAICDCDCLYDITIKLSGVERKTYTFVFIEPYSGDQDKLIFEIDLATQISGKACVDRKQYPWGMGI